MRFQAIGTDKRIDGFTGPTVECMDGRTFGLRTDWTGQHDHEVDGVASSAFFFCDMCYYQLLVLEFSAACVTCFLFDFIRAYFHIVNQPQAEVDTIRLELEWCFVFCFR